MISKSKPGPGYYFDPLIRAWVEITAADKLTARTYLNQGYHQASGKYRLIGLVNLQTGCVDGPHIELTPGEFAAFREQRGHDADIRRAHDREERRPKAKRFVQILAALPQARQEELLLDLLCGHAYVEFDYAREAKLFTVIYEWVSQNE